MINSDYIIYKLLENEESKEQKLVCKLKLAYQSVKIRELVRENMKFMNIIKCEINEIFVFLNNLFPMYDYSHLS